MLILVASLTFIYCRNRNFLGADYIDAIPKWLIILFIVAMSGTFIYALYRIIRTAPMAIINQRGIWIKQFGVIPWANILDFNTFLSNESIGILVRDTVMLSKQATIAGKLIIFESKILRCPTIVIDNIELDSQTIISFANQFIATSRQ